MKVLHNHAKGDVFDMVKNLNLPLEHGGGSLLKKLQALGLHSNRFVFTGGQVWAQSMLNRRGAIEG